MSDDPAGSADPEDAWRRLAACRGMETAVFYPADSERGQRLARRERRAKQICARCPVIDSCLQWALAAREPYGVWGGMSAKERARLLGPSAWGAGESGD